MWLNLDEFVAFLEHARNVSSRASVRADDSEPDPQFTEWGIQLAPSDEGDHVSYLDANNAQPSRRVASTSHQENSLGNTAGFSDELLGR